MKINRLLEEAMPSSCQGAKEAPLPGAVEWAASGPELKGHKDIATWKAILDMLTIGHGWRLMRWKSKNWVKRHKPSWPAVPDID